MRAGVFRFEKPPETVKLDCVCKSICERSQALSFLSLDFIQTTRICIIPENSVHIASFAPLRAVSLSKQEAAHLALSGRGNSRRLPRAFPRADAV